MTPATNSEAVTYVSDADIRAVLEEVADEIGLTLDEFLEKGRADELEGEARDHYLMWGPIENA